MKFGGFKKIKKIKKKRRRQLPPLPYYVLTSIIKNKMGIRWIIKLVYICYEINFQFEMKLRLRKINEKNTQRLVR